MSWRLRPASTRKRAEGGGGAAAPAGAAFVNAIAVSTPAIARAREVRIPNPPAGFRASRRPEYGSHITCLRYRPARHTAGSGGGTNDEANLRDGGGGVRTGGDAGGGPDGGRVPERLGGGSGGGVCAGGGRGGERRG